MRSSYSQLVRLLRRLELPPEVRTLYFGGVRELEQAVAKCGLVENQHFERINESCGVLPSERGADYRAADLPGPSTCSKLFRHSLDARNGSPLLWHVMNYLGVYVWTVPATVTKA